MAGGLTEDPRRHLRAPAAPPGEGADPVTGVEVVGVRTGGPARVTVLEHMLLILVAIAAALHLPVILHTAVQWDEFRFLADVHAFNQGSGTAAFQRFHVHLFGWVTRVGGDEVSQVLAARGFYLVLLLGTCLFAYMIGRRFLAPASALFAVLCYLSFREVMVSGTSFRYDGLSVFFLLGSLALIVRRGSGPPALLAAGGASAIALLVTAKSIFYLPTLVAAVLLRARATPLKQRTQDLAIFALALVGAFAVGMLYHSLSLPAGAVGESASGMQRTGQRALSLEPPFPARQYLAVAVFMNAIIWLFLALGITSLLRRLRSGSERRETFLALALLAPLLSLVIYRNAFTYYYVFLMPGVLVIAGVRFDEMLERARREQTAAPLVFLVLMIMGAVLTLGLNQAHVHRHPTVSGGEMLRAQRQIVETVHRMFPDPVPYIDAGSMISSFPKHGFFMSSWGFANYSDGGAPIFRRILIDEAPLFLLANQSALRVHDDAPADGDANPERLLAPDHQTLRDNYVPHWGPILVAGKRIPTVDDSTPTPFEILIPGTYTVEAPEPVVINGVDYEPGSHVDLELGTHSLVSPAGSQRVVLRWGVDLYRSTEAPIPLPELRRARPVSEGPA